MHERVSRCGRVCDRKVLVVPVIVPLTLRAVTGLAFPLPALPALWRLTGAQLDVRHID